MRKIVNWLHGWAITPHIMVFDRKLYRSLTSEFNPADFTEVDEP